MMKSAKEYFRYLVTNPRDSVWGLCVTGAGYQPAAAGFNHVPRRHHPPGHFYVWEAGRTLNEYAVVYVTRGQGEFESQSTGLREVQAGDAFLLFPGVWHRYRPSMNTGWASYWVHFHGETADRLQATGVLDCERPIVRVGVDDALLQGFATVLDVLRTETHGFAQIAAARTTEILARLTSAATNDRPVPRVQKIVRRAKMLLEEDPTSLPAIDELIRRFDISRTHFFRIFKQQTGQSPYRYHLHLTMQRAAEMLRDSELPVKHVAEALGFRNPYHFSKLFKAKMRLSPLFYRRHWQAVADADATERRNRPP